MKYNLYFHCSENTAFYIFTAVKYRFFKICIIFNQYFSVFHYFVYNKITYSSLIRYQIPFFTPYQSPARGCKAALCTPNPRHEKTYLQGSAPRGWGWGGVLWNFHTNVGSGHFFFLGGGGSSKCNAYKKY